MVDKMCLGKKIWRHNIRGTKHLWGQNICRTKRSSGHIFKIHARILTFGDASSCHRKNHISYLVSLRTSFSLRTFCPHGCLVSRMFCPARRFVPSDVLSLRTFSPRILYLRLLCRRTFCLWTFCCSGRYFSQDVLSGHPYIGLSL
jgi:hypothetical protein